MKTAVLKFVCLFVLLLQLACREKAKTTSTETSIILEGTYNGNNLYVKNPAGPDGFGFCVNEIVINGNRTSDEISGEHIEIDLKASGVREGNPIKIEIKHYKGCEPKVLNPEVLK
ncbi:MAG TPA: hypothetical protein VN026_14090 [Bacteroidia bacterium]|jgi:hypothetical protein|nr:hypothetical protein [Bacteroidia bacterium]